MNRLFGLFLLSFSVVGFAQAPRMTSGATVYIEPMDGYETYLAAAFVKKRVPLVVVLDQRKAEYAITSSVNHRIPNQPAVVISNTNVNNTTVNSTNVRNGDDDVWNQAKERAQARSAARAALGSTDVSISVIDARSSQMVFAYSVGKHGTSHQTQSTAEACAKHLKEFIEKSDKPTK
jgi:hypothetical protein